MSCNYPRKLHPNLECPIDNIVYKIVEPLSTICHYFNMTPNQITTISLIFGIIAIYFSLKRKIWVFTLFYALSYIFDCVDGYYARKYGMCTDFGDFYDHTKDVLILGIVVFIIFKHCLKKRKYLPVIIVSLSIFLSIVQMGCQQLHASCKDKNSNSINILKSLCPSGDFLKISRWFGVGTMNLIIILMMFYLFNK